MMTVAMMLPTIAPLVLAHRMVVPTAERRLVPTIAFCSGYLAVWALTGVLPLALLIAFSHIAHGSTWIDRTGGAVFVLAGVYQFTPWEQRCLRVCRTPANFLATHDYGSGYVGAVPVGLSNGLCCLGSRWALMAALFAVGVMNLAWMAAIALVFVAEKNWRHGVGLTTLVGIALVGLGVAVLVHPHLLGLFAFVHHVTTMSR